MAYQGKAVGAGFQRGRGRPAQLAIGADGERTIKAFLVFIASVLGLVIVFVSYGLMTGSGRAPARTPDAAAEVVEARPAQTPPPIAAPAAPAVTAPVEPPATAAAPEPPAQAQAAAPAAALQTAPVAMPAAAAVVARVPPAAEPAQPAPLNRTAIREAQRNLARLGFDPGLVDGTMGRGTRRAIRDYQGANGLPQTGQLDPALAERLAQGPQ